MKPMKRNAREMWNCNTDIYPLINITIADHDLLARQPLMKATRIKSKKKIVTPKMRCVMSERDKRSRTLGGHILVMKCVNVGYKKMQGGVIDESLFREMSRMQSGGIWQLTNHCPRSGPECGKTHERAKIDRYKTMHPRENWSGPNHDALTGEYGTRERAQNGTIN